MSHKSTRPIGQVRRLALVSMPGLIAMACAGADAIESEVETSEHEIIFGTDDRIDVYRLTDANDIANADGTVALFRSNQVIDQGDGTSILRTQPFTNDKSGKNVCPDQPLYGQQQGAFSSGFLVAPDVVATTGHSLHPDIPIEYTRVVFGFRMYDKSTLRSRVRNDQIYSAVSILARSGPESDWALFTLDRPVTDHKILPVRRNGNVEVNTVINVIGHPWGVPEKFSGPGRVKFLEMSTNSFHSTLDTAPGNSGSPVFNDVTNLVEGIHAAGSSEYIFNTARGCSEELRCRDDGSGASCSTVVGTFSSMFVNHIPEACVGPVGGYEACRGSGCAVCTDKLNLSTYDLYFKNHPNCFPNPSCGGQFHSCSAACPAPTAADRSAGSLLSWKACRGSGVFVCQEKLTGYPHYFQNHPRCKPNTTCGGSYSPCSLACPAPTAADQ